MYYYLSGYNPQPDYLIVRVDGLSNGLYSLEQDSGLMLDDTLILNTLTNCLTNKHNAKMELEYCFMDLVSKQHHRQMYDERDFEIYMRYLQMFSNMLSQSLNDVCVYQNGLFNYAYRNRNNDDIRFIKKRILMNQIKKEMEDDGLYSTSRAPVIKYPRFVQRNRKSFI